MPGRISGFCGITLIGKDGASECSIAITWQTIVSALRVESREAPPTRNMASCRAPMPHRAMCLATRSEVSSWILTEKHMRQTCDRLGVSFPGPFTQPSASSHNNRRCGNASLRRELLYSQAASFPSKQQACEEVLRADGRGARLASATSDVPGTPLAVTSVTVS